MIFTLFFVSPFVKFDCVGLFFGFLFGNQPHTRSSVPPWDWLVQLLLHLLELVVLFYNSFWFHFSYFSFMQYGDKKCIIVQIWCQQLSVNSQAQIQSSLISYFFPVLCLFSFIAQSQCNYLYSPFIFLLFVLFVSWYCFLICGDKVATEILARCGGSWREHGSAARVGAHVPSDVGRERRQHLRAGWGFQTLAEAMANTVWWLLLIY